MIMLLMVVIQQTFLFKFLSNMGGRDQLALMGASYRVYYFAFVPMWGLGQGLLPLIGMNYGAQNFKRVMAIFTSFTLKATVIALVMWGVLMIFGRSVLSWFITDTHLVSYGTGLFKILNGAVFIAGLLNTPIVLFQAIGKAKQPMIICIGRQVFFFIPLLLVLPRFLGVLGIWLAIPISDFIIALIAFGLVIREKKYMHMGIRSEPLVANQNQAKVSVKNSDWPEGEILSDMITNEKRKVHISPDLLGLQKNSKHQQIKARLTQIVQQLLKDLGINRTEAVKLLGVTQEQASALIHCFPGPVSIGCLLECLTTLGQNVEVTIKPASCVKVMVTTSSPQRCSPQEAGSTLEGEDGPLGATVLEFAANIVSIKYPGRKKQPFQGSTSDLSLD
jgi:predicted XRE-type DNA-binding protein